MEDLYADNLDPWQNGKRGLYNVLMRQLVSKIALHLTTRRVEWHDIGAGGGNVLRGIELNRSEIVPGIIFDYAGVDLSPTAVSAILDSREFGFKFEQADLEEYIYDPTNPPLWSSADIISWIEVLYYFGDKRPWKQSFEEFWKGVKPGAIVIVADSLIPYQYRDYLKKHEGAELLDEYTDYTQAVHIETRADGRNWTRWLKVRVYRKK
jgi:SAM-dependent methyltransferase